MKTLSVGCATAASKRIRHVFATHVQVVISYSGGKDGTCVPGLGSGGTQAGQALFGVCKAAVDGAPTPAVARD